MLGRDLRLVFDVWTASGLLVVSCSSTAGGILLLCTLHSAAQVPISDAPDLTRGLRARANNGFRVAEFNTAFDLP